MGSLPCDFAQNLTELSTTFVQNPGPEEDFFLTQFSLIAPYMCLRRVQQHSVAGTLVSIKSYAIIHLSAINIYSSVPVTSCIFLEILVVTLSILLNINRF